MQDRQLHLLVTPYQNKKLPVYRWYNYNHSFSRDLVIKIIEKFNLNAKDKILDPFCGSGTTLLASKERGIPAIGIDILPLSVFISNAKVRTYKESIIKKSTYEIKKLLESTRYSPNVDISKSQLVKLFPSNVLSQIILVREWCNKRRSESLRYFFLTTLLSILEKVSYARKDGGFLRILPNKNIPDFNSLFFAQLKEMFNDLKFLNSLPSVYSQAFEGDARQMKFKDGTFSAIITSPPYLNRHDYTRVYMLELLTAFISSQYSLKDLRYKTLRSHVEAKKIFDTNGYIPPHILIEILNELKQRPLPNKQVINMIEGYFEDMFLVLKECKRVIKRKGSDILTEIGNKLNLKMKEKIIARVRGNSPQQMGKYGKVPTEENILIWEKK